MVNSPVLTSEVSLYFHIPFCTKKCDYCHFYVLPDKAPLKQAFMEALRQEWQIQLPLLALKKVASIYFGGGTPYLIGPQAIREILSWVKEALPFTEDDIEITLEANPENIEIGSMQAYKAAGINRVSIGVQTLDNPLLHSLGRLHSANKSLESVHITHSAGIENISIDLMYDLPRQTLSHWQSTLDQIKNLPITHLSLYNLTIEPHTAFFKHRKSLAPLIPNEEESLAMYKTAVDQLKGMNLLQYEISAFCKEGFYARHNTGYWIGRPFLGFGPSAFSYWEGCRFRNIANLSKYASQLKKGLSPIDFEEELDPQAQQRELLTIGIRLLDGVDLEKFENKNCLPEETLKIIERLCAEGYLLQENSQLKLTAKGIIFYDHVATELI